LRPRKGEVPENFKNSKKHRCPQCKHIGVSVTDKRNQYGTEPYLDYSRRRRQCNQCSYKWSTVEIHAKFYDLMKKVAKGVEKVEQKAEKQADKSKNEAREKLRATVRKIEGRS
jgi:transcriptional regulator NrdR family protein